MKLQVGVRSNGLGLRNYGLRFRDGRGGGFGFGGLGFRVQGSGFKVCAFPNLFFGGGGEGGGGGWCVCVYIGINASKGNQTERELSNEMQTGRT